VPNPWVLLTGQYQFPKSIVCLPKPKVHRRDKLEGAVTLRFIVTARGAVEDININEIQGDERFGDEAIRVISQWRFSPAIRAGKPVPCWCFQKINFEFIR